MLFVIYIKDLDINIDVSVSKSADDTQNWRSCGQPEILLDDAAGY